MWLVRILDLFALSTALVAAWLWYRAGNCPTRRISLGETIDAQDFNRIVTAINRAGILNRARRWRARRRRWPWRSSSRTI